MAKNFKFSFGGWDEGRLFSYLATREQKLRRIEKISTLLAPLPFLPLGLLVLSVASHDRLFNPDAPALPAAEVYPIWFSLLGLAFVLWAVQRSWRVVAKALIDRLYGDKDVREAILASWCPRCLGLRRRCSLNNVMLVTPLKQHGTIATGTGGFYARGVDDNRFVRERDAAHLKAQVDEFFRITREAKARESMETTPIALTRSNFRQIKSLI